MTRTRHFRPAERSRGIALIAVLLLLLIVTLIGLAAMRGTLLQERMSANVQSRALAFQLAEAILREGEARAADAPAMPAAGEACVNGLCPNPGTSVGYWEDIDNYRTSTIEGEDMTAGLVIEDMGTGSEVSDSCTTSIDVTSAGCSTTVRRYQITARVALDNGTEVVLQSRYQVE